LRNAYVWIVAWRGDGARRARNNSAGRKNLPPTRSSFHHPGLREDRAIYEKSPQSRLWNDAAMKRSANKFIAQLKEQFIAPLERDFGVKLAITARAAGPIYARHHPERLVRQRRRFARRAAAARQRKTKAPRSKKSAVCARNWLDSAAHQTKKSATWNFIVPLSATTYPDAERFLPAKQQSGTRQEPEKESPEKSRSSWASSSRCSSRHKYAGSRARRRGLTGGSSPGWR